MNLLLCILLFYCVFVGGLILGWRRMSKTSLKRGEVRKAFSIIVPIRNELENLPSLLKSLLNLRHPDYEIVVVDDHSDDGSFEAVAALASEKLRIILSQGIGKKAAITTGIEICKNDFIVTSDADCSHPPDWLDAFEQGFEDGIQMVAGPVGVGNEVGFFSRLQKIEFFSLVAVAGGSAGWRKPVLCSGANLAYRRTAFESVAGFEGNLQISSGDDEFLMRKFLLKWPAPFRYVVTESNTVLTTPQANLKSFVEQRLRWAGKWRKNSSAAALFTAFFLVIAQGSFFLGLVSLLYAPMAVLSFAVLLKVILEACLLFQVARRTGQSFYWLEFLLLQLTYPIYCIGIGLAANFIRPEWRGRNVNN